MEIQKNENIFKSIIGFQNKEDGTYDIRTGLVVEYSDGYQVSFVRPEAFKQLDAEKWDYLVNYYCRYLDSIVHIGVYDSGKEVSFRSLDRDKAEDVMKIYNQESILDWNEKSSYPDEPSRWFITNKLFDVNVVINYDKIIRDIL